MKTPTTQTNDFRPTIGRIAVALALITVIGGICVTPALAKGDDRRDERKHERGRDHRGNQHPYYSQPVYAPPPVYYAPQQSPGISFFLPLNFR